MLKIYRVDFQVNTRNFLCSLTFPVLKLFIQRDAAIFTELQILLVDENKYFHCVIFTV